MRFNKTIIYSLIAHVILIGLLAANFQFSKVEVKQSKNPRQINATSVNAKDVKEHLRKLKQKDINKKNKEIERLREIQRKKDLDKKKKQEVEDKKKKEKQRKADADRKKKLDKTKQDKKKSDDAKKKKVADEKARKKKADADKKLAAKNKADKKKKNKAEADRKRKKKEDAEKKRKEDARRKKMAEEKAAQEALENEMELQMADEAAALNDAKQQQILTEVDKYNLLIRNKIKRNWIAPEQKGSCVFRITMAPGGLILSVTVLSGNSLHCDTGRRAINKSEPLPVSSDSDIFAVLKTRTFELENKEDKEEYDN